MSDSLLDTIKSSLGHLGYRPGSNPWTCDTRSPGDQRVLRALENVESQLDFRFPNLYRHFIVTCATNLVDSGFLVPWQSERNVIDINLFFRLPKNTLAFRHEEDGSLFCFHKTDQEPNHAVYDESDQLVYPDFRSFLQLEIHRWLLNAINRRESELQRLNELREKLSTTSH